MNRTPRALHVTLALVLIVILGAVQTARAQVPTPTPNPTATSTAVATPAGEQAPVDPLDAQVDALLAKMSVADKVGQLFLISFPGDSVSFDSDITELVYGYRVGGVILSPRYGNFSNEQGADTPTQVARLVNQLQGLAYGVLLPPEQALLAADAPLWPPEGAISMEDATAVVPINLPLLVGVEQAGDGPLGTALRRGFTPLPSEMALGATWNPELATQIGEIVGRELAAVGVNLLLGPNLDVLAQPRPDIVGTLGIHSFGGDPYWVSRLGRAYIAGVHSGGAGRVAAIARHFPGAGDADRLPDQEVATVQHSSEELRQIALPPFLAVTRGPSSIFTEDGDPAAAEGMMSSHIRYSGFQGSSQGRNTPLSLAPELEMVLNETGFADWRRQGGLLISNLLGAPAIRRHYDPALTEFPSRRVAMDAFTAGHDILYLSRFSLDDQWESEKQNIKETIGFFQDRYIRDADFAAQVDAAVRRTLRLKLRLYGVDGSAADDAGEASPIAPAEALVHGSDLAVLAETSALASVTVGQVAREAFTLLYPDPASADGASAVPQTEDKILIFTDSRLVRECEECISETAVGPDELANIILRLYGPEGTGQLRPENVVSLTFADLAELLETEQAAETNTEGVRLATPTPTPAATLVVPQPTPADTPPAEDAEVTDEVLPELDKNAKTNLLIEEADWVLFAMLDVDPTRYPSSAVVKDFLRLRGNQLATKHIVVLGLHAPYFLDATEISKLNAYYGVYSKTQPFLESAVRALFRAFAPIGAPPVSVPGTRFGSLAERLAPDAARGIELQVTTPEGEVVAGAAVETAPAQPMVEVGQLVRVQAGPILDHNGHPVRDGTIVEMRFTYTDDPANSETESAPTQNGVALRDVMLSRAGTVQVEAQTGDAVTAQAVALSVQAAPGAEPAAALTTTIAATTALTGTTPLTVAAEPVVTAPGDPLPGQRINLVSLIVALFTIVATTLLLLIVQVRVLPRATLVHSILWAVNCGLLGYILYGLGLVPGGAWLQSSLRVWGAGLVVFVAMLLPLVWLQLRTE